MARREKRTVEDNTKVVADALAQIVRFSLNEPFRKKCFDVLQVEGSFDLQKESYEKLLKSVQPVAYHGTQSSGYSSQNSQTAAPTQSSQASSIVCNIENASLSTNLGKRDEVHVNYHMYDKLPKSAAFYDSLLGKQSQYTHLNSASSLSPRSIYNSAGTTQSLDADRITQSTAHSRLLPMSQEEKDLEEALEWGEDSEEDTPNINVNNPL